MAWSTQLKSHPLYWPSKLLLKRLTGRELWIRPDVRIDVCAVGEWQLSTARLDSTSVVYSLGVGDSIDFDLKLIRRCEVVVHAFDPTPFAVQWLASQALPKQFVFHPWAVAGGDGTLKMVQRVNKRGRKSKVMWTVAEENSADENVIEVPCFSIASIIKKLNHVTVDVLKMDVEGSEYQIIDALLESPSRPSQLLVEFHHRFATIGLEATIRSIAKLKAAGYRIFAVSATGREIGFIHQSQL